MVKKKKNLVKLSKKITKLIKALSDLKKVKSKVVVYMFFLIIKFCDDDCYNKKFYRLLDLLKHQNQWINNKQEIFYIRASALFFNKYKFIL